MPAPSSTASAFQSANPHALATILAASETQRIIAATDIFDIAGTKLWARNQPVSAELQRKLLDRKLREPLESCLVAEDGVTPASLVERFEQLVEGDARLAPVLRPHAAQLVREAAHLPLHPVAQLLLSAGAGGAAADLRPRDCRDGPGRRADGRARRPDAGDPAGHAVRPAARPRRDVHRPAARRGRGRPRARLR